MRSYGSASTERIDFSNRENYTHVMLEQNQLDQALEMLGALLEERGEQIGGCSSAAEACFCSERSSAPLPT